MIEQLKQVKTLLSKASINITELLKLIPSLNDYLQTTALHLDRLEEHEVKIPLAKLIKQILAKESNIFTQDKILQKFATLILQQTSKLTGFQRDLHGYLISKFSFESLKGLMEIQKEGSLYDKAGKMIGTADLVINIFDNNGEIVKQYVIECDGSSHNTKDDSRRNGQLTKYFPDSHLIIEHGEFGFAGFDKKEIDEFVAKIKAEEIVQKAKAERKAEQERFASQDRHLGGFAVLENEAGAWVEELDKGELPKKRDRGTLGSGSESGKRKYKSTPKESEEELLELAILQARQEEAQMLAKKGEAIEIMEELLASRLSITEVIGKFFPPTKQGSKQTKSTLQQESCAKFLPEAFNHLFENDPWLALDFLQQFDTQDKKNQSLSKSLIDIIQPKLSSLLEKEIYHPFLLRPQISFFQVLKTSSAEKIKNILKKLINDDQPDLFGKIFSEIDKKIDIDPVFNNVNLLMTSAAYGREGFLKYLLGRMSKYDINIQGVRRNTALSFAVAAMSQDLTIVNMLLEAGADPNIANERGEIPLMRACEQGNLNAVKLLIENGANVDACDNDNRSALFFTTNFDVAKFLIEKGATLFARDQQNRPAYISLLKNPAHEVLKFLNQCNTDANFAIIESLENGKYQITIEKGTVRLLEGEDLLKKIIKYADRLCGGETFVAQLQEGVNAAVIENFIAESVSAPLPITMLTSALAAWCCRRRSVP